MRLGDLVRAMLVTALITVSMDYAATMVGCALSMAPLEANNVVACASGLLGAQLATTLTFVSVLALLLLSYIVLRLSFRNGRSALTAPIMLSLYAYLSVMHASGFLSWLEIILRSV